MIKIECHIVDFYFDKRSLDSMIQTLEEVFIINHEQELLDTIFPLLFKSEKYESLTLLFDFFEETQKLQSLKKTWTDLIRKQGTAIIHHTVLEKKASVLQITKEILELKQFTDKVLQECFKNKDTFKYAQREGFEYFLNQDFSPEKSANLLA